MNTLLGHFFVALLAIMLGWGGIAHASEAPQTGVAVACAFGNCADAKAADADLSGDHDTETPCAIHAHGGCHGHHQLDATKHITFTLRDVAQIAPDAARSHFNILKLSFADLRPPIA